MTLVELYNEQLIDLLDGATVGQIVAPDESLSLVDDAGVDDSSSHNNNPDEDSSSDRPPSKSGTKLSVRKGAHGMYVEGATRRSVTNVTDVLELLKYGTKMRQTEATNLNEASSRSHLIMIVDVIGVNTDTQVTSYGRLSMIDLAGSERVKASGSSGARLVEAAHINRSLSALADVFTALVDTKAKHIPFRNSKYDHWHQTQASDTLSRVYV